MRAVIISGGDITDYSLIKKNINNDDFIVCADKGFYHAEKMGLKTDLLVGDFDSLEEIPKNIKSVRYPTNKNFTDTEIAIEHARKMGISDFLIIAGTGSRIDHTLTNIFLLKDCLSQNEKAVIINENNKIMITETSLQIQGEKGSIVSLVPLCDCKGVCTENLLYPLKNADLFLGKGLGVSNIMTSENAGVSLKSGVLLIIIAHD